MPACLPASRTGFGDEDLRFRALENINEVRCWQRFAETHQTAFPPCFQPLRPCWSSAVRLLTGDWDSKLRAHAAANPCKTGT